MTFGPFHRLRLRVLTNPEPAVVSSEEDSDGSSPECDKLHVVHVLTPRRFRKSGDRLNTPDSRTSHDASERSAESAHIAISLHKPSHPNKLSRSGLTSVTCPSDADTALRPSPKPTLIRRVTSKLMISVPSKSSPQPLRTRPSTRTLPAHTESPSRERRSSRTKITITPTLPNSIVTKGHREAALRERGLLPPCKDLSEQERDADARLRYFPSPVSTTSDGLSEAEQLRATWFATNRTSESSDSEWRPPAPPYLLGSRTRAHPTMASSSSSVPLDVDVVRRSSEGRMDLSSGRHSTSSSCPPLSTSSNLEVLPEEPSEQVPSPMTPSKLMITVSNAHDPMTSPVVVESPVSCTFSSHCPGSTSSDPAVQEKENMFPRPRRSVDRPPRRAIGLSTMGTRSLTNLRRSIAGSLGLPSSSTLSTADVPPTPTSFHLAAGQAPRTAISPTIHSLGSILWETKDIEDMESRRLSELAFLD